MKLLILTCLVASVLAAPSIRIKKNILPGDARYNDEHHQIHGEQKPQENEIEIANALGNNFRCFSGLGVPVAVPKAVENTPDFVIYKAGEAPTGTVVSNGAAIATDKASEQSHSDNENGSTLVREEPVAAVVSDRIAESDVTAVKEPVEAASQPEAPSAVVLDSVKSDEQVQLSEEVTKVDAKPEEAGPINVAQHPQATYNQDRETSFAGVSQSQEAKYGRPQVASPVGVAQSPVFEFFQPQQPSFAGVAQSYETKYVQPQQPSFAGVAQSYETKYVQPQQPSFAGVAQSYETKYVQPQVTSFANVEQSPVGTYIQYQPTSFAGVAQNQEAKFVQPEVPSRINFAQRPVTVFVQPQEASFAGVAQSQEAKFVQPEVTSPVGVAQSPITEYFESQRPSDAGVGQSHDAKYSYAGFAHNQEAKFVQPEVPSQVTFSQNPVTLFVQPQEASFTGFDQSQEGKFVQHEVSSQDNVAQRPVAASVQPQEPSFAGLAQSEEAKFVQHQVASPVGAAQSSGAGYFQPQQSSVAGFDQSQEGKFVQHEVPSQDNVAKSPVAAFAQPQEVSSAGVAQNQETKSVRPEGVSFFSGFLQKTEVTKSEVQASTDEKEETKPAVAGQNGQHQTPAISSGYVARTPESVKSVETENHKKDNKLQATKAASDASAKPFSGVTATPTFNAATAFPNKFDSSFGSTFSSRFGSQVGSTFPASSSGAAAPYTPGFNSYDHTKYNNPHHQFGYGYNPGFEGYKGSNQYYNNYQYNRPGSYNQFSGYPFGFGTYSGQYNQGFGNPADSRFPVGTFPHSYSAGYNKNFPYVHPQPFQFGSTGYTVPQTASFSSIQQSKTFDSKASKDQKQIVKSPESLVQPTTASFQESSQVQA